MSATAVYEWRGRQALDFYSLALAIWAGLWFIVATSFVCSFALVMVSYYVTPLFLAEAVLVPSTSERVSLGYSMGNLQPSLSGATNVGSVNALTRLGVDTSRSATEEAVATLFSRELVDQFIRENNLAPLFFASRWDEASKQWKVPVEEQPTEADAFEFFNSKVRTLARDARTGFVTLQIRWRDPETAAAWANDLVERLNAHLRTQAIARSAKSLESLENLLAAATLRDDRDAINRMLAAQVNERMLANVSEEYAFRVIDHALPPDKHDRVWPPSRVLVLIAGGTIGFVLGVALIMLAYAVRRDDASG